MTLEAETKAKKRALDAVLDDLSPESLKVVRHFAEFLRHRADQGQPAVAAEPGVPYLYPSVGTPISNMQALARLLTEGYDGDSVLDTEALYDGDCQA